MSNITLAHGAGGKAMHKLIDELFLTTFSSQPLTAQEDQARFPLAGFAPADAQLAFTTDCYVVHPLFFPGGDIGTLAVNGTVNDLAVGGATPRYLSAGFIIEEGLEIAVLERIVRSMQAAADQSGVAIVTGDTKVVPRGACDKLFINTAGIGYIESGVNINAHRAAPGDVVIVNHYLGDHGAAILDARGELGLSNPVASDCRPLNALIAAMLKTGCDIRCLRDATRGGLATVLNEFALASGVAIDIDETALPIRPEVRGVCELLGLDPLYLANEGVLVAVLPETDAEAVINALHSLPGGELAAVIGRVRESQGGTVRLNTHFGSQRILDVLSGEQLPRIC